MAATHWGKGWDEPPDTRHPTIIRFLEMNGGRLEVVSPHSGEMLYIPAAHIPELSLSLQARLHKRWHKSAWTEDRPCRAWLTAADLLEIYHVVKKIRDAAPKP